MAISALSTARTTTHGVLVSVSGAGVLIIGESGMGKSDCALDLVSQGHKLIADDVVLLERVGDSVFGEAPGRFVGLLAVDGIGIIDVRQTFGSGAFQLKTSIGMCIEFRKRGTSVENDFLTPRSLYELLGVEIPKFTFSVQNGRNLRLLVETVVKVIDGNDMTMVTLAGTHDEIVAAASHK